MRLLTALLFLPLFWLSGLALAAEGDPLPVPELRAPVTDLAQLLSPADAQALNARLLAFSQEKGSQVAVLIVPTTAPEDIFSYSFRVADAWKLGRKGVDDGVLLVVAVNDRKTHLQVGYGLEGPIPDARSKQVLQDIIRPRFQQGDFAGGIHAGVDAVIKLINGEGLPMPAARAGGQGQQGGNGFIVAIIAGVIAGFLARAVLGRLMGTVAGGGVAFAVAMLLGLAVGAAVMAAVFALFAANASGRGGFIPGGGFGRGGFGGDGFGGGGFGGGGGGFGGGGASGNW
ncbi:MAG: hypothetical protein K0Q68_2908 [Moraxellaceae bacterium]|jgi:uncharacterized protein|nr:hypothetical protein [Moraxellaceae bacterium]